MLELWNVLNIAIMVGVIKLAEFARGREFQRNIPNDLRLGLIVGVYYDAQIAILCSVITLSLILAEIIGVLGAFTFGLLCVALLMVGPRMTRTLVAAFTVPHIKPKKYNYHAAGTYRPEQVRARKRT